jgi:AcrR family transcriptional regulator
MKVKKSSVPMGRPRAFDTDQALDRAMQVFWLKGYQGASLAELTKAMGINRPSLYAAFGDKQALFRKALDRYADGPAGYVREALKETRARAVVERLLGGAAELLTDPLNPQGCLMVQGALSCGATADPIRQELNARRAAGEAEICARLERAKAEGDLPPDSNPADTAHYFVTVMRGMAVQAAGGASRDELRRVVTMAMRVWPE